MLPKRYKKSNDVLPDRRVLEIGEARVLYQTWLWNKNKTWVNEAIERTERLYGPGAPMRIRQYMRDMREGRLE